MDDSKMSLKAKRVPGLIMFSWLEKGNSTRNIIYFLSVICAGLLVADFFYHRHGHFKIEELPGFFAIYGYVMFSLIIFLATLLRFFVKRREDYYGKKAVDSEVQKLENSKGST